MHELVAIEGYFHRVGPSVKYKTRADVTVAHPIRRLTTALTEAQWRDACYWTLLAVCNHGDLSTTFRNADHLETFTNQEIDNLLSHFATASAE